MKYIIYILTLIILLDNCYANKNIPLKDIMHGTYQLMVADVYNGNVILSHEKSPKDSVKPGSLIKLLLTGAVIDLCDNNCNYCYIDHEIKRNIKAINVMSNNRLANDILMNLGVEKYGAPGSKQKGVNAIVEFLMAQSLPMDEVKIFDGSGLNDGNRITANFIVKYLVAVSKKPWFKDFYESLPRPGLEGTVKDIGYTNEKFRVKSGRLKDVFALAGYGVDARGRDIAFAYIVNVPNAYKMNFELTGAQVLKYLATEALP